MEKFDKWMMPDGEKHLPEWMTKVNRRERGRLTYQYSKYEYALSLVKEKNLAIDVGAHIGLWSYYMAHDFKDVACFEPKEEHRECWHKNMADQKNAEIFSCALGKTFGKVRMKTGSASSGDTFVDPEVSGDIEMKPLDFFKFENVSMIKIDCEGFEYDVLRGAEQTIFRSRPVIVVEQKGDMIKKYGHEKLAAVRLLKEMGAVLKKEISGDYILDWE